MARKWVISSQEVGVQNIADTETVQKMPLGLVVTAKDSDYGAAANDKGVGEFIYLKGVGSTVAGSWVTYNPDDWTTNLLAANAIGSVAVALSANVANQFGWYQIKGKAIGSALAGYVDNALVFATATPGSVDDAVVAGDRVKNALGASNLSGSTAEFEIDHPFMDDGTAA